MIGRIGVGIGLIELGIGLIELRIALRIHNLSFHSLSVHLQLGQYRSWDRSDRTRDRSKN